jgi:4-hydroxythreonine-4-phosphate dehydrogenase
MVFMYHDQANIGRKILGRDSPGVSLFLGMPVPVVTVPHGTAYDIAWKGTANHSMLARAVATTAALAASGALTPSKWRTAGGSQLMGEEEMP